MDDEILIGESLNDAIQVAEIEFEHFESGRTSAQIFQRSLFQAVYHPDLNAPGQVVANYAGAKEARPTGYKDAFHLIYSNCCVLAQSICSRKPSTSLTTGTAG